MIEWLQWALSAHVTWGWLLVYLTFGNIVDRIDGYRHKH